VQFDQFHALHRDFIIADTEGFERVLESQEALGEGGPVLDKSSIIHPGWMSRMASSSLIRWKGEWSLFRPYR